MCLRVMKTKTYYIFSQCSKVNHKSKCRSISKLFDGKIKLLEQNFCEKSGVRINMIDTVNVLPGTRIITDMWQSYNALPNHSAVNHGLHFVDPNDPTVHTNTIEGT